jgi:hypothetical protein
MWAALARRGPRLARTTVGVALCAVALGAGADGGRRSREPAGLPCDAPTEQELQVARLPLVYAVVDSPARQIALKARGVVLRRFRLRALWAAGGLPSRAGPLWLVTKRPLIEPVPRMPPAPGAPAAGAAPPEPAPLTAAAMPARYRLVFEGGLSIWVHPGGAPGRWQRLWDTLGAARDRLAARATVVAGRITGKPQQALVVELASEEARALYWAARPPLPLLLRRGCP